LEGQAHVDDFVRENFVGGRAKRTGKTIWSLFSPASGQTGKSEALFIHAWLNLFAQLNSKPIISVHFFGKISPCTTFISSLHRRFLEQ
jgi:hypothetical protein